MKRSGEDSAVKAQDISDTSDTPVSLPNFNELSIDDVRAIIGRVAKKPDISFGPHAYIISSTMPG